MAYRAITTTALPAHGVTKMLYSEDLFDTTTGAYPKTSPPATVNYALDAGVLSFFDHAEVVGADGTLKIIFKVSDDYRHVWIPDDPAMYEADGFEVNITTDEAGTNIIDTITITGATSYHGGTQQLTVAEGNYYLQLPTTTTGSVTDFSEKPSVETLGTYTVSPRGATPVTITAATTTTVNVSAGSFNPS